MSEPGRRVTRAGLAAASGAAGDVRPEPAGAGRGEQGGRVRAEILCK